MLIKFMVGWCIVFTILSTLGMWIPNRFGASMLWFMLALMFIASGK
ncbi:MAG TPA: hypothetical protein VIK72_09475 [Clostridiaceae bacterium]